jgi:putative DNA methylase
MRTTRKGTPEMRSIEADDYPFEFLSRLAERESWRKEIHRPIYHVHKWWAKRLGSVFRGILLGCTLPKGADLASEFYVTRAPSATTVFDPFMGSGTTIGEAHKLSMIALGRDINPVAVEAVATAFGPMDRQNIIAAFDRLSATVGDKIRALYTSNDSSGRLCDVLYYFWVMQTNCPACAGNVDLFSSYVIARNAYPDRKPEVQILCPSCGNIFQGLHTDRSSTCPACRQRFDPSAGAARGAKAHCQRCRHDFTIVSTMGTRTGSPSFRAYAKLVLTCDGYKEYLPVSSADTAAYSLCTATLREEVAAGRLRVPDLALEDGHNTRQAMSYGFRSWRDFFNDRQLVALGWLQQAIENIADPPTRRAMATLFSGVLEFNNMFASYKGEGTGAVRHMFSHHILKPERVPIEANIWGTPKSSGSFSNLFRGRLLRTMDYRDMPVEIVGKDGIARMCSPPFSGVVELDWPPRGPLAQRGIYLSCGDSANTGLADGSVDIVVTDPPFFDNVHYSELADFFFAWQQLTVRRGDEPPRSTRRRSEVQDADAQGFAKKLEDVFRECGRILRDDGIMAFTYHHSRPEGWTALAGALVGAGFVVVNSQPVKAEMSVATPKSQAKEPIQLDIIVVCRKRGTAGTERVVPAEDAVRSARAKIRRLHDDGFTLSQNDLRIVIYGQLLTTVRSAEDAYAIGEQVEAVLKTVHLVERPVLPERQQRFLF